MSKRFSRTKTFSLSSSGRENCVHSRSGGEPDGYLENHHNDCEPVMFHGTLRQLPIPIASVRLCRARLADPPLAKDRSAPPAIVIPDQGGFVGVSGSLLSQWTSLFCSSSRLGFQFARFLPT
jgi:hypothetical protein